MNSTRPLEFTAFIGIDWADKKHDVCLQLAGSEKTEHQIFKHTAEAIDEWARALRERFEGRHVAVCLELTKGPIVSALQKYDFFVLFPVNPITLAKYRQAFMPSGKKDELCAAISDYRIFASLPGAAEVFAPRLLCAFGEDRERFRDAKELQRYAGVAPVTEMSGNTRWVHWRFRCPAFLRQSFVEWAAETIPRSFWAGAFYAQQRARGASHQAALRALAFKWFRILFRCWQDRTLYDESSYLKTLQRRHAPLLHSAANSIAQS